MISKFCGNPQKYGGPEGYMFNPLKFGTLELCLKKILFSKPHLDDVKEPKKIKPNCQSQRLLHFLAVYWSNVLGWFRLASKSSFSVFNFILFFAMDAHLMRSSLWMTSIWTLKWTLILSTRHISWLSEKVFSAVITEYPSIEV